MRNTETQKSIIFSNLKYRNLQYCFIFSEIVETSKFISKAIENENNFANCSKNNVEKINVSEDSNDNSSSDSSSDSRSDSSSDSSNDSRSDSSSDSRSSASSNKESNSTGRESSSSDSSTSTRKKSIYSSKEHISNKENSPINKELPKIKKNTNVMKNNDSQINLKKNNRKGKNIRTKTKKIIFGKREMIRGADILKLSNSDYFFLKSRQEIIQKVKYMNHATRFFLAVKFVRKNPCDFSTNVKIQSNFSQNEICRLLEVQYGSVDRYITNMNTDNLSINKAMEKTNYMTPTEFNPLRFEQFFKNYASNYEELKIGGVFKTRI